MAIVQEQKAQGQGASTTPSVSWPSTPTANNLLIAILFSGASSITTPPAGYTAFPGFSPGTDQHPIYYKVAAGTETSVDFVVNEASYYGLAIFEYSGLKTTGVADQNDTAESAAAESLTVTAPAQNASANSLIMVSGSTWWVDIDFTWSAGYTEEYDVVEDGWMNFGVASRIVSALETPSCEVSQDAGSTKEMSAVMAVFSADDSTAHQESETEAVGVTDSTSRDFERLRPATDAVGVIDAISPAKASPRTASSPVGIVDDVTREHARRLQPLLVRASGRWDTGPTPGQDIAAYLSDDDSGTYAEPEYF